MRSMKKIAAAVLSVTMLVSLTACGSSGSTDAATTAAASTGAATTAVGGAKDDAKPAEAAEPKVEIDRTKEFVTVATGPTSGIYYPIGGAFATALGNAGYKTSAQATGHPLKIST